MARKYHVGRMFPTNKEGILTVVAESGKKIDNKYEYILECSICSEDTELFPYGTFTSYRIDNLEKGASVCNCSPYSWKDWQCLIRLRRCCEEEPYEILGFVGEFKSCNKTKVVFKNTRDNYICRNVTISSFLGGCRGERDGRKQSRTTKQYGVTVWLGRFFNSGKFKIGTIFGRLDRVGLDNRQIFWGYWCPECSNDEYVQNGLCSGIFEGAQGDLVKGQLSCRCGNYYWNQQQREYQINKILAERNQGVFIGWVSEKGYKNSQSKFKWECSTCKYGNTSQTYRFLSEGQLCRGCHTTGGFAPNHQGYFYLYSWYGFGYEFYKFGITNRTPEIRAKEQYSVGQLDYNKIICHLFKNGYIAKELEKMVSDTIDTKICPKQWLPDGYTETTSATKENLNIILNLLEDFKSKEEIP